jgi:hypothetical protein
MSAKPKEGLPQHFKLLLTNHGRNYEARVMILNALTMLNCLWRKFGKTSGLKNMISPLGIAEKFDNDKSYT